MLLSENPIDEPARSYLKYVVDRVEQPQAELTITMKKPEELKAIVQTRARQRAGKGIYRRGEGSASSLGSRGSGEKRKEEEEKSEYQSQPRKKES
jgi:hypothetical protein